MAYPELKSVPSRAHSGPSRCFCLLSRLGPKDSLPAPKLPWELPPTLLGTPDPRSRQLRTPLSYWVVGPTPAHWSNQLPPSSLGPICPRPCGRRLALDPDGPVPSSASLPPASSFPCLLPGSHTQAPPSGCPVPWTPAHLCLLPPFPAPGGRLVPHPRSPDSVASWTSGPAEAGAPVCGCVALGTSPDPCTPVFSSAEWGHSTGYAVIRGGRAQPGGRQAPTVQEQGLTGLAL